MSSFNIPRSSPKILREADLLQTPIISAHGRYDDRGRNMAYHGKDLGYDSFYEWGPPAQYWTEPTCEWNDEPPDNSTLSISGIDYELIGMNLAQQARPGSEANYANGLVRTRFDMSKGSSGSPYFYCPTGNCNAALALFGLHAVYYTGPASRRHRGPMANNFRSFVSANAP